MPDNIFDSECVAIVNTTNIQGVMGGGLALQFRQRYPEMFEAYKLACSKGEHKMGEMLFYNDRSGKIIVNFPTMKHPGMWAKLSDIEDGLKDLRHMLLTLSDTEQADPAITSIAIPGLGCGIGRLSWGEVAPLIKEHLGDIQGLTVELYPPDAPKYTL